MDVRRGTRASQLHRPRRWSHYSRGRWRSSSKIMTYVMSLIRAMLDTLESRHEQLTERLFKRCVLRESFCLHYLLQDKRDSSITDKLLHAKTFKPLPTRTVKFRKSFIPPLFMPLWLGRTLHVTLQAWLFYYHFITCTMYELLHWTSGLL